MTEPKGISIVVSEVTFRIFTLSIPGHSPSFTIQAAPLILSCIFNHRPERIFTIINSFMVVINEIQTISP